MTEPEYDFLDHDVDNYSDDWFCNGCPFAEDGTGWECQCCSFLHGDEEDFNPFDI